MTEEQLEIFMEKFTRLVDYYQVTSMAQMAFAETESMRLEIYNRQLDMLEQQADWRNHTCGECGFFGVPLEMLTKRKYNAEPHECRRTECEVYAEMNACPDCVPREVME